MNNRVVFSNKNQKITVEDIKSTLVSLGIKDGDDICVHSSLFQIGKLQTPTDNSLRLICDTLVDIVGRDGTVCMPTFTYSFCKGEDFDVNHSPSTVGLLTEFFRNNIATSRTMHPIFSYSLIGKNENEYLDTQLDALGQDGIFDKMIKSHCKLVLLGVNRGYTNYYYSEKKAGVSYRFDKAFSGKIIDGNTEVECTVPYFARKLDIRSIEDEDKVSDYLTKIGLQKSAAIGRGNVFVVDMFDMNEAIINQLHEDEKSFLIEEITLDEHYKNRQCK